MKARPILFSAPMINALLAGTKTQTRRVVNAAGLCPYGKPGDYLWCRETWLFDSEQVHYRASSSMEGAAKMLGGWRPSIFMPRQHSRLTLRITDVRAERVQEIIYEDACAEGVGIPPLADSDPMDWEKTSRRLKWPQRAYMDLWMSINGEASWHQNPFVWCISFKVIQQNVDEVMRGAA